MATSNLGLGWQTDKTYQPLNGDVKTFLPGTGYLKAGVEGKGAAWDGGIKQWFLDNQGASDQTIHKTMDSYGVSPIDVARATGADLNDTNYRYQHSGEQTAQPAAPAPQQNLGMGGTPAPQSQANPYLDQMASGITDQMNQNWQRNQLPSIRSGAMAAGGFGGSRQGVVEANGLNDMNRSLGQSLTSLYGQDWTNSQNRNLQQQQLTNQNNQYYSGLDSNNAQFGANLGLNTMNAQNQWAMNGVNAANQIQQQPINYFNGFNANTNSIGGNSGTESKVNQGNPWISALGGLETANKLYGGK